MFALISLTENQLQVMSVWRAGADTENNFRWGAFPFYSMGRFEIGPKTVISYRKTEVRLYKRKQESKKKRRK